MSEGNPYAKKRSSTTKLKIPMKYHPEIMEMLVDGKSASDILEFLTLKGLSLSLSTVSHTITRLRAERKQIVHDSITQTVEAYIPKDLDKVNTIIEKAFKTLNKVFNDSKEARIYAKILLDFIKLRLDLFGIDVNKKIPDEELQAAILKKLGL